MVVSKKKFLRHLSCWLSFAISLALSFHTRKLSSRKCASTTNRRSLILLSTSFPQNNQNNSNSTLTIFTNTNESILSPFSADGDDYYNISSSSSIDQTTKSTGKTAVLTSYMKNMEGIMRRFSKRSFSVIDGSFAGDIGFDPLGK